MKSLIATQPGYSSSRQPWRSRLPLLSLIGLSVMMMARPSQANTIIVENKGDSAMWVTIASQKKNLVESADGVKADREIEAHLRYKNESSAGLEGVELGSSNEIDMGGRYATVDESTKSRTYNWSPFIEEGEAKIEPGRTDEFEVPDDQSIYYLTLRRAGGYLYVNVPKSATKHSRLTIDNDGFPRPSERRIIGQSSRVYLQSTVTDNRPEPHYLGYPQASKGYPAGVHTEAGFVHVIGIGGQPANTLIKNGSTNVVILTENDTTHYGGYRLLYCSVKGWTYYAQRDGNDDTQHWTITRAGAGKDPYIREGDRIVIANKYYSNYFLSTKENSKWATCTEDDREQWIILLAD